VKSSLSISPCRDNCVDTDYSILWVKHTQCTADTKYSIHSVQHTLGAAYTE
jgi:hypothetical protein